MPLMGLGHIEMTRDRWLQTIALCVACGSHGIAAAQGAAVRPSTAASPTAAARAAAPIAAASVAAGPSPDSTPTATDIHAAQLCKNVHFVAYSTLEPSGQRVEESVTWDDRSKSYLVRGPILGVMFNDPGVTTIPNDATAPQTLFRIAIRTDYSKPIDRFCEYNFQEMADCDAHGDITYTQIYTGCDLQTLQHAVKITPDQAGTLALIDVSFQDVTGAFSNPLYLSEGTDLRLRVR